MDPSGDPSSFVPFSAERSNLWDLACLHCSLSTYGCVNGGPVDGYVDHSPLVVGGRSEDLVRAAAENGVAVVGVFPIAVGVMDDQSQGPIGAARSPLQHRQGAVGVPGGHDRALPDVPVDRTGLLRAVVDDLDVSGLEEFGPVVADAEVGSADAADHPMRG